MESRELRRNLGLSTAAATVVGCVIGSGVFFKPNVMYTLTGGAPGLAMLVWLLTGLVSIAAALTFAEVAILIPSTGGMMVYMEAAFGKAMGFLTGWMQTVLFYPAMIAALAVACANQAALFIGTGYSVPLSVGVVILLILLNSMGSAVGGGIQVIFTVCKLIPLMALMIFGFLRGPGTGPIFTPLTTGGVSVWSTLGSLMLAVLFAFEGWTNVGAIAGEMKNPARDLPLAIVGGVSVITAIYFVVNVAYLRVLPASELMNLQAPASAVAIVLFGDVGGRIVSVGIMISVFGACNGFVLSGSRVAYRLAVEGSLPCSPWLSRLNRSQTPGNSILLVGSLGAFYAVSGQFDLLTNLAVFSSWIFYTLTFAAVIRLRKTMPNADRAYRVPLYPVIPLVAILSGVYVVVSQIFLSGAAARLLSLGSIAATLLGLPIRLLVERRRESPPHP